MSENKPSKEQIDKWKSRVADPNVSEPIKETFRKLLEKWDKGVEEVEEAVGVKKERKPRASKPKASKPKAERKPRATKQTGEDVEKAKAEIKKRTGKTEEECEKIIEEYRALRTKAQERKHQEEKATQDNKKRVEKLEKKGDIIEGTTEKTADAVIETAKVDVVEKIEKEIEKVEEKAEKEAKKEVEKEMPKKSATEKKEAIEKKVEKKVQEKTKVVVKRVVVDTSALLTSIADTLGKFDKDSQKEFLIKLRSDIDKLLSKYAFGGDVSGATQGYNITQSNLSASSVNMFANGGGVENITEEEAEKKLEQAKKEGKCTLSIGLHGQIYMQTIGTGAFMKSYRNYKEAYESFLIQTKQYARGGGIYSSDDMYILKVYDLSGKLLDDSKMVRARNISKAKEEAIDMYEYAMQQKYGTDLRFQVELAPPRMAQGGMTEHGLKLGDRVVSYSDIVPLIDVRDKNGNIRVVDLDEGKRYDRGGGVGKWSVSDITNATYLGVIEFQDNEGEFHNFEVMETDDRLVFGGMTNSGFIESGYIEKDGFSTDEALQSLLEDLEVYYNDGAEYTSQIVFNQRMAKGGGVRKVGGREYPFGSAWALEHNKVNKREKHEVPSSQRRKKYVRGGGMSDAIKNRRGY